MNDPRDGACPMAQCAHQQRSPAPIHLRRLPAFVFALPLYTDARLYTAAGIPTVLYGAGPHTLLEANGHRADEKLRLDELYRATEVVARCLHDLLAT